MNKIPDQATDTTAALAAQSKNLTLRAYNVANHAEIHADIFRNGIPTGHQTPYTFSAAEFLPGDYYLQKEGYINWMPGCVTINVLAGSITFPFYATPGS